MKFHEIKNRGKIIASKPIMKPFNEKLLDAYEEFYKKTYTSYSLYKKAREVLPHGCQHTHPLTDPYPVFINHGKGSKIFDVDNNAYIDYMLGGSAILLGHNHDRIQNKVIELLQNKTHFHGYSDEYEIMAAYKIIDLFDSIEKVRFTSSGSEANLAAARIARSYTGKKKIIKFRSGYHGWGDQFMTDMEVPGSGTFLSHGIPEEFLSQTVLVYPNDLESINQAFKKNKDNGGIAAIICEPFGGESGLVPFEEGFLNNVQKIAHKNEALLIFDEIVTGFSAGIGGAQKLYGIKPDITTLGKALMNGYPSCGAVGGKKEIIETGSNQLPTGSASFAYVAGTMSANTLSTAACYFTLCELEKPGIMESAINKAESLCKKMNEMFDAYGVDFFSYNFGTILKTELTAPHYIPITSEKDLMEILSRRKILSKYALIVQNEGIMSRMGRDMLSCSHTDEDIDFYIKAYEKLLNVLGIEQNSKLYSFDHNESLVS